MRDKSKPDDKFNPVGETRPIKSFAFDEKRYVFISHPSGTDPSLLRAIVRSLLRRRVSVWIYKTDACELTEAEARGVRVQKSEPGKNWQDQVRFAVEAASLVLLLVGKGSVDNKDQQIEIDRAIELEKFMTVRVDDVSPTALPEALQQDLNLLLDPNSENQRIVRNGVRLLASAIGQNVLGKDYVAPRTEGALMGGIRRVPPVAWAATSAVAVIALVGVLLVQPGAYKSVTYVALPPPELVIPAAAEQTGPRLALVISQTRYSHGFTPVLSAKSEGDMIERALHQVNFTVHRANDRSARQLQKSLDDFRHEVAEKGPTAIAFVYYTGHGIRDPGSDDSYMLGIDARLRSRADLATYGVKLSAERDKLRDLGTRAVFLVFDACRDTPTVPGFKSGTKGLARLLPAKDMLVAYATGLGDVAKEGLYAPVLAEELVQAGQKATAAFHDTADDVHTASRGTQTPHMESSVTLVCFVSCPEP
jgi:hypothetical protein